MAPLERLTLTVPEAAAVLGVSDSHIYRACRAGELPSVRVGRRVLIPKHELEAILGAPVACSSPVGIALAADGEEHGADRAHTGETSSTGAPINGASRSTPERKTPPRLEPEAASQKAADGATSARRS